MAGEPVGHSPRTVVWFEGTLRDMLNANPFNRATILDDAKTKLKDFRYKEVVEVVNIGLNILTKHRNPKLREGVLNLFDKIIPVDRIDAHTLSTTYINSLNVLTSDIPVENTIDLVKAGARLSRGFPKKETVYRHLTSAFDKTTAIYQDQASTLPAVIEVTKRDIEDGIVRYYTTRNQTRGDFLREVIIRRLRDSEITLPQLAIACNTSVRVIEATIKDLTEAGCFDPKERRAPNRPPGKS